MSTAVSWAHRPALLLSEVLRNAERGMSIGSFHIPPMYGASQILVAIVFIVVIIFWPKGLLGDREINFNRLWSLLLPPKKEREGFK